MSAAASVRANELLLWRINDLRTGGLLLYGRHIGGLTASIGTPHTFLDAAFNRTTALFFKPKAGADVALAGLFALRAGRDPFIAEVAAALEGQPIGDGIIGRIIRDTQRQFGHPEPLPEESRWSRDKPRFERSSKRAY
jgi:hypothetical protein